MIEAATGRAAEERVALAVAKVDEAQQALDAAKEELEVARTELKKWLVMKPVAGK